MEFDRPAGGIDLHVHSTASDGTCAPSQLLHLARKAGLSAMSITDHDTTEGAREAQACEKPAGLHLLSGVEISTAPPARCPMTGSLHILGYGYNLHDPELNRALTILQSARKERNPRILERLRAIGIDLAPEAIAVQEPDVQIGRPHIARALMDAGHAASIDDAFDRFLAHGRPAYVDKYRIPCEEAVEKLRRAGGIPVLAHPFLLPNLDGESLHRLVADLVDAGLGGIESYYPGHTAQQTETALELARRFDLLVTGGTDFHGDLTPGVQLGSGFGDLYVPFSVYEAIAAALSAR